MKKQYIAPKCFRCQLLTYVPLLAGSAPHIQKAVVKNWNTEEETEIGVQEEDANTFGEDDLAKKGYDPWEGWE